VRIPHLPFNLGAEIPGWAAILIDETTFRISAEAPCQRTPRSPLSSRRIAQTATYPGNDFAPIRYFKPGRRVFEVPLTGSIIQVTKFGGGTVLFWVRTRSAIA
jgi:hypothetical protein